MTVSQDFKESMRMLHREVQSMKQEHRQMQKEIADLKKQLAATEDGAIKRHKTAAMSAIASGDNNAMDILKATSVDPSEQELLRQHQKMAPNVQPFPNVNQELYQQMLNNHQAVQPVEINIEVNDRASLKRQKLMAQMDANAQTSKAQQQIANRINGARRIQQQREAHEYYNSRLGQRSDAWRGAMDF